LIILFFRRITSACCGLARLVELVGNDYFLVGERTLAANPPAVIQKARTHPETLKHWSTLPLILSVSLFASTDLKAQDSTAWVESIRHPQYFAVLVSDVDESVNWYQTVFGLRGVGGSRADDGSWRIENLNNEFLFVEIIRDDRVTETGDALGFAKVGFSVPDVQAVADRVARTTGEAPRVLDFEEFNQRLIQIRDPDGNIIQLTSVLRN